jgi:signal transduction histidine kinase/ligand-binding sensor domain-containing protein/DNA-binding response OmpR family regulator
MNKNHILFFLFCFITFPPKIFALSFGESPEFRSPWVYHINIEQGLPGNWVRSILQDENGIMWFGTWNGLASWDGVKIKTYRKEDGIKDLNSNMVTFLSEDPLGNIWIGTAGSFIHIYDIKLERIFPLEAVNDSINPFETAHCVFFSDNHAWIGTNFGLVQFNFIEKTVNIHKNEYLLNRNQSQRINKITKGPDGNLWLATPHGLHFYSINNYKFIQPNIQNSSAPQFPHIPTSFYTDEHGRMWLGAKQGFFLYDEAENKFFSINSKKTDEKSQDEIEILAITGDGNGNLFIGTSNSGMKVFNFNSARFFDIPNDISKNHTLNSNSVHSLYYDKSGILWIGTYNGGVNYFKSSHNRFYHITASENGLTNPYVLDLQEDNHGNIWIGTENGLTRYSNDFNEYANFLDDDSNIKYVIRKVTTTINNEIWLSIHNQGLTKFNPETGKTGIIYSFRNDQTMLDNIIMLKEIEEDVLLVGANNGFRVFNTQTGKDYSLEEFYNLDSFEINFGRSIFQKKGSNDILITYANQIVLFNVHDQTLKKVFSKSDAEKPIGTFIISIYDKAGNIWTGTPDGIYLISKDSVINKVDLSNLELTSHSIVNIFEDNLGNIWFTTINELVKIPYEQIELRTISFQTFNHFDGLQRAEFKEGANFLSESGRIYIGGNNGFNYFNPHEIDINKTIPEVIFTSLRINNQIVTPEEEGSVLNESVKRTKSIRLDHTRTHISVSFTCTNYLIPEKNQYAYKLEGLDNNWQYIGNKTDVNFFKPPPGSYTLWVKASNNDGIWNETGTPLRITVLPPWWQSKPFYLTLLLFLIFGFIFYYRLKTRSINQRNKLLEARVLEKTSELIQLNEQLKLQNIKIIEQKNHVEELAEKIHEKDEQKLRFFTNISHEFRTPLSLIIDPIDNLLNTAPDSQRSQLLLIKRNANRLLNLIDQCIDLRKIDQKMLQLKITKYDLNQLIAEIAEMFASKAKEEGIQIVINKSQQQLKSYFDKDKMEKVIINLISNAIKNSRSGGFVAIDLDFMKEKNEVFACIAVKDNGVGISENDLPYIFERFYSGSNKNNEKNKGYGIGLTFCKELIQLHKGTIDVISSEGQGATFRIQIPVSKDSYDETQISEGQAQVTADFELITDYQIFKKEGAEYLSETEILKTNFISNNSLPVILIIEDHKELRRHLIAGLYELGNIYEADNGLTGWELCKAIIPDIVISDIMMPGMDGVTLCEKIKNEDPTNHIPVILLTAKSGLESELDGVTKGADDYITKPFNMSILKAKIYNVISLKSKLKEKLTQNSILDMSQLSDSSTDEKYLKYLTRIVQENMQDTGFSVEQLGRVVNMDRFQLYRKILAITGMSPSKYITRIRLSSALERLKKRNASVSEVAYDVGFNSPSYFARCFREAFGVQPSRYSELLEKREYL